MMSTDVPRGPRFGPETLQVQQIADPIRKKLTGHSTKYEPPFGEEPHAPAGLDGLRPDDAISPRGLGLWWAKQKGRPYGLWFQPWTTPKPEPIPADTIEKIAACAALGLSYWCDAPSDRAGRGEVSGTFVWATDGYSAHLVNIRPRIKLAIGACATYSRLPQAAHNCEWSRESSVYTVPADDEGLWEITKPAGPVPSGPAPVVPQQNRASA